MEKLPPYAQFLGIEARRSEQGELLYVMPFGDAVLGRPGYLHGGAIAGLLEFAAIGAIFDALGSSAGVTVKPINVTVYTEGTGVIPDDKISHLVQEHFDLRPRGIVTMLDLLRPIYQKTAAYGHFGREEPEFTWEATDKVAILREAAGLKGEHKRSPVSA